MRENPRKCSIPHTITCDGIAMYVIKVITIAIRKIFIPLFKLLLLKEQTIPHIVMKIIGITGS